MKTLDSIPGRITNGFYEKPVICDEDFAISGHQKYSIELKMCELVRGGRVLLGGSMRKLESISGRIANGFYEKAAISEENFWISGHQKY